MRIRSMLLAAATVFAGSASAATCTPSTFSLGALPNATPVSFSSSCTGGSGPNGDASRSFVDYYSFTLTDPVSWMYGHLNLYPERDFNPSSPTRGEFLSGISIQSISLIFGGAETGIGTGIGIGSAERASFYAGDLAAGDYTLAIRGATFGLTGDGHYSANMGIDYSYVSTAPEPSTYAMMVLGLLGVGYAARRRKTGR